MIIEGKVWKFGNNIDTDIMMPVQETLARPDISIEEAARFCMSPIHPGWASRVGKGDIIIAGRNWGCGSSRPAARLFKALGIGGIAADSMTRVFFRNAINVGLPVLICNGVSALFEEGNIARVHMEKGEVTNISRELVVCGEALLPDSPPLQILKAGGLMDFMEKHTA